MLGVLPVEEREIGFGISGEKKKKKQYLVSGYYVPGSVPTLKILLFLITTHRTQNCYLLNLWRHNHIDYVTCQRLPTEIVSHSHGLQISLA